MKLKLFSFDFDEGFITFRVPREYMLSHRWGAGEAEVDLREINGEKDEIPKTKGGVGCGN